MESNFTLRRPTELTNQCCHDLCLFLDTAQTLTFLRSTMSQERLNHIAILHVHRELTDQLDLNEICNDFVQRNDQRGNVSALFK